jgi:hypothetical protein
MAARRPGEALCRVRRRRARRLPELGRQRRKKRRICWQWFVPRWGRGGTGLLVPGRLSQGVDALTSPPAANLVWHRDLSVFPRRPVVPSGFLRSPAAAKLPYLVPGLPWETRGGDSGGVVSAPVKAGSTGFSTTKLVAHKVWTSRRHAQNGVDGRRTADLRAPSNRSFVPSLGGPSSAERPP